MRRFSLLFLVAVVMGPLVRAQWRSIKDVDSYERLSPVTVEFLSGAARVRLDVLAEDLVRVRLAPTGTFAPDRSPAVVKPTWDEPRVDVIARDEYVDVATGALTIRVFKKPLRLRFIDREGTILNEDDPSKGMAWDGDEVRIWKRMPDDESYYGFGLKAGRLNKKFADMTMWNSDIPGYHADTDPLYESIPFFYGIRDGKAYGIFFDNSYLSSFDMGKESPDRYSFGALGGELNYYFMGGPTPKDVLQRYTELVGRMPLPPLWSLGYQQSRWSYYPEERVRKLAQTFREKRIPADVLYLDIDYMEGFRIFTWSKKNFPDPKKMIEDLSSQGFKIAVIVDPGIKRDTAYHAYISGLRGDHFLKYPNGRVYIGKVWPGECAFPDFSDPAVRRWWGDQFSVLIDAGVRGWWNDMNEPSIFDVPTKTIDRTVIHYDEGLKTPHTKNHNLYGLRMTQATYEGVRRLLPRERPFVLTRASYAGGHRYSAAWTGDNVASWEHLRMALPMCLNLSISGQPFVGTDIGGFVRSPDGELFARWLQFAVFTPLMRAHTEINTPDQEPWSYGPEFEAINRSTIELRYELLPYLYNAMVKAAHTGIPPLKPLMFVHPDDPSLQVNDTEFYFGNDIVAAPVLRPGETRRRVRLPRGMWYDFWTREKIEGGTFVTVDAPLDRIPMFVRAGAIIPTQPVMQYVGERSVDPLVFTCYPGENANSEYYEDDGRSFEYEKGVYYKRAIRLGETSASLIVTFSPVEGTFRPPDRSIEVRLIDVPNAPVSIAIDGQRLPAVVSSANPSRWWYEQDSRILHVRFPDRDSTIQIEIVRNH